MELKDLYQDHFTHRLRQRPSMDTFSELHDQQSDLLRKRLMMTRMQQTEDWTEEEVVKVLKSLKNNKAKDPLGLVNELFKPPVAGADLIKSLTIIMNNIKKDNSIPELFRMKNISPVYKNKGSRNDLINDRGIFNCTVITNILQKLLYLRNYDQIDDILSDSNVGSRKNKNIRNHIFVLGGIMNEALQSKSNIDILVNDFK